MKTIQLAMLLLYAALWLNPANAAPVELRVQPVVKDGTFSALDVALRFNGAASGSTRVHLPNEWGGERELYKSVRDLRAQGATIAPGDAPHVRVLTHAPNARITLRYRVVDDAQGPPDTNKGNDYRPKIAARYFHVLGNALVAQPLSIDGKSLARFELRGMPAWAKAASDLDHQHTGRVLTFDDLTESVLVGGDFRVIDAGGGKRMAIRGQWQQSDAQWRSAFMQIAQSQRAYWGSKGEPYLVTVLPIAMQGPGSISIGGTGRSDAFAFFATPNAGLDRIVQVMAHEMMHTWVPRRIGGLPEQNEQLQYWLSEGFTDWASWRVLVRSGIWSPKDFAQAFNEALQDYENSPVKAAPNAMVLEKFWTDPHVQKLPYRRGMLAAIYWDHKLQIATQGKQRFDDVLLAMQRMAEPRQARLSPYAPDLFKQAMREVAGIDISNDLAEYIERGVPVPLSADTFAPCGTLNTVERAVFHRGFDIESTVANNNTVTGVVADGPAYQAGLRDGMKLIGRKGGKIGDSTQEIGYEVKDGDAVRLLKWMPQGKERERVRQFEITRTAQSDPACVKRLGG
ncbi:MAG: hypothetical protein ACRCV9_03365 [Burkholderiaceae bacterium]